MIDWGHLSERLRSGSRAPTTHELAELVWLAGMVSAGRVDRTDGTGARSENPLEDRGSRLELERAESDVAEPATRAEISLDAPSSGSGRSVGEPAAPVGGYVERRRPSGEPSLAIRRAVNRFGRVAPVGREEVDVQSSVRWSAEVDDVVVASARVEEVVSNLLVVVDDAVSLLPWEEEVAAIVLAARRSGRFTRVTEVRVDLSKPHGAVVRKSEPAAGIRSASAPAEPLLVLVVTDTLAPGVRSGALIRLLDALPGPAEVAILHPWGPGRWARTPMGELEPQRPVPFRPGSEALAAARVGVTPEFLARLVPYARGLGSGGLGGVRITRRKAPSGREGLGAEVEYTELVDALPPVARQVLGLVASVPGNLDYPLLSALVAAGLTTREATPVEIAEALTSGLLERVGTDDRPMVRFRESERDGRSRGREVVLAWMPTDKAEAVLTFLARLVDRPGGPPVGLGIPFQLLRALRRGEALPEGAPVGRTARHALRALVALTGLKGGSQLTELLDASEPGDGSTRLREEGGPRVLPPSAVPPVWNIRKPPVHFVGREAELAHLGALVSGARALIGLGGVGKSALARQWVWSHASGASLGWWLRGDTQEIFDEDLLGLGRAIGLLPETGALEDRAAAINLLRAWLHTPKALPSVKNPERPWILVVDNAGDPASLQVPIGPGVTLVTSRDRRWARLARVLTVEVLQPDAAAMLLLAGLDGSENGAAAARALAAELGWLPLALEQAHRVCLETGVSLSRCHERIRHSPRLLGYEVGAGEATVASVWAMSVERLSVAARALLEGVAFFAPDDVPVEALFAVAPEGVSAEIGSLCGDADLFDDALGELHRNCLVERTGDRLDIHRLVQRVTRDSLDETARHRRMTDAQGLLLAALPHPEEPQGWPLWRRLASHCAELAREGVPPSDRILGLLAWFLCTQGEYREAVSLERRALVISERAFGPDHPGVASRMGNLASTLAALGSYAEARPLQERALAIVERALGPDHPDTATALGRLAETLSALGRHAEARPLEERALAITERVHGPNGLETAIKLGNLAATLSALGWHAEARPLNERALRITEEAQGPDHPDTARRLRALAATLSALGLHPEERYLNERALAIAEGVFGSDHPETARTLSNLAATLSALGLHEQARSLNERALVITERAVGPDHPDTARRLASLAQTLSALAWHSEARALSERALTITERALGPEHVDTAGLLRVTASVASRAGRQAEARGYLKRCLDILVHAHGHDHPDTLRVRQALEVWGG